ncbi:MAG: nuclear transport factor 2 family protein [Chloroflexota bacterium]
MNDAHKDTSTSEQEILDAEKEWVNVVVHRDKTAADKILADEFRLTGPDLERLSTGQAATKDVWLETLDFIETRSFDLNDTQVMIYGSAAVVFLRATIDWSIRGNPLPSNYMLTDLWVNRDGRWQVLTRLSEPLG